MAKLEHITAAVQNVTTGDKIQHFLQWLSVEMSFLTVTEWITLVVGISAVIAYISMTISHFHQSRHYLHQIRSLKDESQKNDDE